jgi:Nucleotidyl transferase AbiEii toxin, Type IV TA system
MTSSASGRYATPEAARRAVTDRLRIRARPNGPWAMADLQRQYAYDQLVERLYRIDGGWVIKGATALLARRVAVRHTIDIDVYRAGTITQMERELRLAAALDIGDWVRFDVGPVLRIRAAGADAARLRVTASIGTKLWAAFHVDAVADGIHMTGQPDRVPPLTDVDVLDRDRAQWRAYPLVDHVADKTCAIQERHDGRPSTRFKDLVDLVAIVVSSTVDATLQIDALHREADRRQLTLPAAFTVPDRTLWETGYRAEARRAVGLTALTLEEALDTVRPFLDPLLTSTATGSWLPGTGWTTTP